MFPAPCLQLFGLFAVKLRLKHHRWQPGGTGGLRSDKAGGWLLAQRSTPHLQAFFLRFLLQPGNILPIIRGWGQEFRVATVPIQVNQLGEEQRRGPTVNQNVVRREHQVVAVGIPAKQPQPQWGRAEQIERLAEVGRGKLRSLSVAGIRIGGSIWRAGGGHRHHLPVELRRGGHHLHRVFHVLVIKRNTQVGVAHQHRIRAARQQGLIKVAVNAEHELHVVRVRTGTQAVQGQQPLLQRCCRENINNCFTHCHLQMLPARGTNHHRIGRTGHPWRDPPMLSPLWCRIAAAWNPRWHPVRGWWVPPTRPGW